MLRTGTRDSPGSAAFLARRLANQVGQQVLIELRRAEEQRRVVVQPVNAATAATLRYQDWVETNRSRVETAAGGRIGYLHLRAMGAGDMADFVRQFHAQLQAALDHLLRRLEEEPINPPEAEPIPPRGTPGRDVR
jgi:C-terminal processing protease CtpA/Prc